MIVFFPDSSFAKKKKEKKFVKLLSLPVKQLKEEKHSGQRDDIKRSGLQFIQSVSTEHRLEEELSPWLWSPRQENQNQVVVPRSQTHRMFDCSII